MTLQFFQNTNAIFEVFKYPGESIYNLRVNIEFLLETQIYESHNVEYIRLYVFILCYNKF